RQHRDLNMHPEEEVETARVRPRELDERTLRPAAQPAIAFEQEELERRGSRSRSGVRMKVEGRGLTAEQDDNTDGRAVVPRRPGDAGQPGRLPSSGRSARLEATAAPDVGLDLSHTTERRLSVIPNEDDLAVGDADDLTGVW